MKNMNSVIDKVKKNVRHVETLGLIKCKVNQM